MAPLGKKELLLWAAEASGIRPCNKYADLRDGVVLLALASRLFPATVDPRLLRRGPIDVERNWGALRRVMERNGLPLHLCDRQAVAAGHARHCFNMLVLFYFLTRLSQDSEFCVDFANPIDAGIAEFLQSPQSLLCVGKLPAACEEGTQLEEEENEKRSGGSAPVPPPPSLSSPSSFPPFASANSSSYPLHAALTTSSADTNSDAEEPVRRGHSGGGVAKTQSLQVSNARLQEELDHVRATSQLMLAQQRTLLTSEVARMTEQFEIRMTMLRLERDHEVRQCLLDMREKYDIFLSDIKENEAAASAPSSSPSFMALRALEGKVQTYERELAEARDTIQQLHNAINLQRARYEGFAEKISSVCATAPPGVSGEDDFLKTMNALLGTQPQGVRDAVILRLKTLLSQVRVPPSEDQRNEPRKKEEEEDDGEEECHGTNGRISGEGQRFRVQLEGSKKAKQFPRQQHQDWYAVPLTDGLEAPSCMIDAETCDAICARANAVAETHTPAASPVRQELQRLVLAIQILQARVQTAANALMAYKEKQQGLREQLLCLQQSRELEAHEQERTFGARLEEQRRRLEANEAALTTKLRLVEERCSRRESVANMVHEQVREMVGSLLKQTHVHDSGGFGSGDESGLALTGVQAALQRLLTDVADSQRTRDSMEAALGELSKEVAILRHDLARRELEVKSLQTSLATVETARREERMELSKATAEADALRDAMTVEMDACRRYIKRVGELLTMMGVSPPSLHQGPPFLAVATTNDNNDTRARTPAPLSELNNVNGIVKDMCAAEQIKETAAAPTGRALVKAAAGAGASTASSLLSPEELERRKMEILSKYGFSNRI
ncbi:hypothetical protein TcBrA4_0023870 [Trypanosoma cruzi]|nr:hypothetical protein TcBrA4_0023870 [Trypanosoma cruzi]